MLGAEEVRFLTAPVHHRAELYLIVDPPIGPGIHNLRQTPYRRKGGASKSLIGELIRRGASCKNLFIQWLESTLNSAQKKAKSQWGFPSRALGEAHP
jgi:hypothetical protein